MQEIENLLARNDIKKAEQVIAKQLRSDPGDHERTKLLLYRARVRLRGGRPDDSINDLLTICSMAPQQADKPELMELLGDAYLARFETASVGFADRADIVQAQENFQRVLNDYPKYPNRGWINYQLGRVALTENVVDRAEHYFQQALLTPSTTRALTAFCFERLGFLTFYERRDLELALGLLDKAVDTYPSTENQAWLAQVHILRSRVLREQRDYKQALRSAETAITIAANAGSENRASLAEALLTAGEMSAGFEGRERDTLDYLHQFLQASRKPLGVDVTWSRVHELLGDAYFKLSQFEMALESYEAALQYNPYHPWEISLHYRIARSYYHRNDYANTIIAIQRLMQAAEAEGEPVNDYHIYDILGNAHFALGQYHDAQESYRTALEIAPGTADGVEKIRKYYQFAQELS
ncbi:MAG: hypothetical protein CL610_09680 [Anaerolineaceae bacterium]|nr:hypothetical protein [Anaerolineaceae bacterium]